MANLPALRCDGCGQTASPEHIARRLQRLEWATRYRPVHIQTLLLGAFAPREDAEFLYAPGGEFRGEAALLLRAAGIGFTEKPAEAVQTEFQGLGYFLTHVFDCPLEAGPESTASQALLLRERLPAMASRIRRSVKPKCVILVTEPLGAIVQDILALDLGCPVVLDQGKPFALHSSVKEGSLLHFREKLPAPVKA